MGDTPKKVEHHFNVNIQCRVVLTEAGIKTLQDHSPYKLALPCWNPQDRTFTSELWDVMHIFGDSHYTGNNNLPFEHNEIVILEGTA